MIPSQFFRIPLPIENPLGFGASDFFLLGLALLIVAATTARASILRAAAIVSARPVVSMAALFALPIALRLLLLPHHPVPLPRVADDFSYMLLGDTLAHFRLANAAHPMRRFFEAVFVLQEPSYSSIYPLGQGIALAFGQLLFREPWAGVLLAEGLLAALCYWMLRGWVDARWALLGGILAAIQFGPFSPWMNTYWGGAVSGIAGCLVFGALPRLRAARRTRNACLLGIGLGLQLLTRPFEFVVVAAIVLLFFLQARSLVIAGLVLLPAAGLMLLQNKEVTGSWITLPYQLSRYQYGVPATFTVQPNAAPHRALTPEQQVDYDAQVAVHGAGTDTLGSYFARLGTRVRFYRFFFLAPLYLAIPAFLLALKDRRLWWVPPALALFWIGDALYPYFYPHYIAVATCLFLLVSVKSLEVMERLKIRQVAAGADIVTIILIVCFAHFAFWYGVYASGNERVLTSLNGEQGWDIVNSGDPEGQIAIDAQLAASPGRQLVFVRYSPRHGAQEWIHDAADIDRARVVWAIDLGSEQDAMLRAYYPDRKVWLLEGDAHPPLLTRWTQR